MLYEVGGLANVMVAVVNKLGSLPSVTTPLVIAPVPVLLVFAEPMMAAAAATLLGSLINTFAPDAASAVGRIRNLSPVFALPPSTMLMPSATNGLSAVPLPVIVTAWPLSVRCKFQPLEVRVST